MSEEMIEEMIKKESREDDKGNNFLKKNKSTMEIEFLGQQINPVWKDGVLRNLYRVAIKTPKSVASFRFWDKSGSNEIPTPTKFFKYVVKNNTGLFDDFCSKYGYKEGNDRALDVYFEAQNEYKHLAKLFNDKQLEELRENFSGAWCLNKGTF